MSEYVDLFFRVADIAISVAILLSIYVGFVRGDLHSRRSTVEIIVLTVTETLEQIKRD